MTGEQAKELLQLENWKALLQEVDGLIYFESKKLMTCPPEEIGAVRQKILAYESIKALPQNVIDRESDE